MARPHATGVALTTTVCMLTSSVASLGHTSSPRRRPGQRHRCPRSTRRRTWRSSTSVHSPWLRSIRRFRSSTALLSPLRSHATPSCRTPAPPGPAAALSAERFARYRPEVTGSAWSEGSNGEEGRGEREKKKNVSLFCPLPTLPRYLYLIPTLSHIASPAIGACGPPDHPSQREPRFNLRPPPPPPPPWLLGKGK